MVLLVLAGQAQSPQPQWLSELAQWTYQSCRAFLEHLSVPHPSLTASNGAPLRALKLGSCWGGWDCNSKQLSRCGTHVHASHLCVQSIAATCAHLASPAPSCSLRVRVSTVRRRFVRADPSYHAPAHYTVFRDYMVQYEDAYGSQPMEGQDAAPFWNSLIETSYAISAPASSSAHAQTRGPVVHSDPMHNSGVATLLLVIVLS